MAAPMPRHLPLALIWVSRICGGSPREPPVTMANFPSNGRTWVTARFVDGAR